MWVASLLFYPTQDEKSNIFSNCSNSHYVVANAPVRFTQGMLCEAISSQNQGIAHLHLQQVQVSTEERRLACVPAAQCRQ